MEENGVNIKPSSHENAVTNFLPPKPRPRRKKPITGSSLCNRQVLGTLNNNVDCIRLQPTRSNSQNIAKKCLSAAALVDSRQRNTTSKNSHQLDGRPRVRKGHQRQSLESRYGGSDSEKEAVVLCAAESTVCEESDSSSNSPPVQAKRRCSGLSATISIRKEQKPVDKADGEPEVDRQPFKPKLACDIVRAAFADRVQLEQLLDVCSYVDYVISANNRSTVDRMMEAADYVMGIMAYEQIRENKEDYVLSDFLGRRQPYLTSDMLTTLADWFVEVQDAFTFNPETVHLAWGLLYCYFDRGKPLHRSHIQLMAFAAIVVACKYEEGKLPAFSELLSNTNGSYKLSDLIAAEKELLVIIDFAVHRPNAYVFLRRYARILDIHSGNVQYMSRFLLDAGLHSHNISLKRDSRKAATCLWLSRVVLRNPSYADWVRRPDVRNLRQLLRTNKTAQRFYEQCGSSTRPLHVSKSTEEIPKSHPVCPESGALDLTTVNNPSTSSSSSRTVSLTRDQRQPNSNMNDPGKQNTSSSLRMDSRAHSEPTIGRPVSNGTTSGGSASAPVRDHPSSGPQNAEFDLDPRIMRELQAMKAEEEQRAPYWPPILQHITGFQETELLPLAVRYHAIAMRLIAEVARGGYLAMNQQAVVTSGDGSVDENDTDGDGNNHGPRCASPGGHCLRRQVVSKYCTDDFGNIANAYPQLAFENFVPYFPNIQCPESCVCFVCRNLIRTTS